MQNQETKEVELSVLESIGHDPALLDEVKTIHDMVGWFIHPDLKPMSIEEMNQVIADTWSQAK